MEFEKWDIMGRGYRSGVDMRILMGDDRGQKY